MRNGLKYFGYSLFALTMLLGCSSGGGGGKGGGSGGAKDGSIENPDGGERDGEVSGEVDASASGGDASSGDDAAMSTDPCAVLSCNPGQKCVIDGGAAHCMDATCEMLTCSGTERCDAHPQGGHVCADNRCSGDVDCASGTFCGSDKLCKADVCTAGVRRCDGQKVFECEDNGGADQMRFMCSTVSYFASTCSATADSATCTCQDDWDCPANTTCENGLCQGTGAAPTCSLPPIPFGDTLPKIELFWGGPDRDNSNAHDGTAVASPPAAPWADYAHVVNTPVVANLDDDNADGLVNELDFPEILFVSHKGNNAWTNGVLRAIHGGGPHKGADYFARCGTKLWNEGMPVPGVGDCTDTMAVGDSGGPGADADSGAPVAVGDLNNDGLPEIVYTLENNKFRILDHTGALVYELSVAYSLDGNGDTPSIANIDMNGWAEIIIGHNVYLLGPQKVVNGVETGITVTRVLVGSSSKGNNTTDGTMACVANVLPDSPGLEIVAGAALYRLPASIPACATSTPTSNPQVPCTDVALELVWNGSTVVGNTNVSGEGFCAVADIWGADITGTIAPGPANPPDGKPEVILIDNGRLEILDGVTGKSIKNVDLAGGTRGGAPNVDDFDGDGYMEVGSALADFYIVVDLQDSTGAGGSCPAWPTLIARKDMPNGAHNPNPKRDPGGNCTMDNQCNAGAVCNKAIGHCVCLHNGWKRDSDDDSSAVTSSSVFDFNGDGAAEAVYNDECDFRVYEGATGELLFTQPSRSRTGIENPVVADVDNDGNAEVVTVMNTTETNRCDDDPGGIPTGPNGLRVWGDPTDTWVSARRIWNEQSYHVTNVTEDGSILAHEPESWKPWAGRLYNTYRSQPRSYGVAPDLTVVGVGISSPDAKCGQLSDNIDISFEIENAGDLRVGPGVVVRFFGTWDGTEEALKGSNGQPLEVVLTASLEPGKSTILKASFSKSFNAKPALPSQVRVVVDPTSQAMPNGAERECHEDNNAKTAPVDPGTLRADLTVELVSVTLECPNAKVQTRVKNVGSAPASNVVVRYFAGDPSQGGTKLHDEMLPDAIAPNGEVTFEVSVELPADRSSAIKIYAQVDPDKLVEECNEANNGASNPTELACNLGPI